MNSNAYFGAMRRRVFQLPWKKEQLSYIQICNSGEILIIAKSKIKSSDFCKFSEIKYTKSITIKYTFLELLKMAFFNRNVSYQLIVADQWAMFMTKEEV